MSGYEVEHNISTTESRPETRRPNHRTRPDLSTFYSTLNLVDTSDPDSHHNAHAVPQPENMTAAYRLLANALQMMQGGGGSDDPNAPLQTMILSLMHSADNPPRELEGVPDSFLDELERVPKKSLKKDDECPICCNPFLDDEFPLVVHLPCHENHRFDLDCIRPWLKLNDTCPLDRKPLIKKREPRRPVKTDDDEEEEWDDLYA
ncbi:uncharacterized protein BDZ99DRAFT_525438 [Mytilinidion resinicola]|uniref:RING-type domain-containing protein n=1 Tax=Mytilinidion resinicola TaxID=574789 RepID=A0A6A6Y9V6_9PEZI|nr:uncharacterized protein BDZ99DRAFT_525438 [Mytilinidion resinicola]KAF2804607.1 hypothetical protein BDZ99DRAFT_525438 [Mytilinidion resinicola]